MRFSMHREQILLPGGVTVRDTNGDRYVIEGLLGKGEAGAVYLVSDRRARQNVLAIKEAINPNQRDRERFSFEAEILRRVYHRALPRPSPVCEREKLKRAYMATE